MIEKLNEVVDAENERQTKLHPVSKTKVSKVIIKAATATHAMPCDVETKATNKKPKQKPEESVQAKLLAAVEAMQAEIVQLCEIVNQQANGKSGGARPRSSFGNNRGIMRRKGCTSCIAHNNVGSCHHCYKCGSAEYFMVNCPKVYSAPESENMKWQPSGGWGLLPQIQICPTTVAIVVRRKNLRSLGSVKDVKVPDTVQKSVKGTTG